MSTQYGIYAAIAAASVGAIAYFDDVKSRHDNATKSVEKKIDYKLAQSREYTAAALHWFSDAETAAARAKESASDANTSAHEARETSTATIDRVRGLLDEQEARFNERELVQLEKINTLEAKLHTHLASDIGAGDLDDANRAALHERCDNIAEERKASNADAVSHWTRVRESVGRRQRPADA